MPWYLWMLAGAAGLVVLTLVYVVINDWFDNRASARRKAVRSTQARAEAKLQQTVQDTIQQMFEATRERR